MAAGEIADTVASPGEGRAPQPEAGSAVDAVPPGALAG